MIEKSEIREKVEYLKHLFSIRDGTDSIKEKNETIEKINQKYKELADILSGSLVILSYTIVDSWTKNITVKKIQGRIWNVRNDCKGYFAIYQGVRFLSQFNIFEISFGDNDNIVFVKEDNADTIERVNKIRKKIEEITKAEEALADQKEKLEDEAREIAKTVFPMIHPKNICYDDHGTWGWCELTGVKY